MPDFGPKFLPELIVHYLESEQQVTPEILFEAHTEYTYDASDDCCGVCLEPMDGLRDGGLDEEDWTTVERGMIATSTVCGHQLHKSCLRTLVVEDDEFWVTPTRMRCPVCRAVWWHSDGLAFVTWEIISLIECIEYGLGHVAMLPRLEDINASSMRLALLIAAYVAVRGPVPGRHINRPAHGRNRATASNSPRYRAMMAAVLDRIDLCECQAHNVRALTGILLSTASLTFQAFPRPQEDDPKLGYAELRSIEDVIVDGLCLVGALAATGVQIWETWAAYADLYGEI